MNIEASRKRNNNNNGERSSSPSKQARAVNDDESSIAQRLKRKASSAFIFAQPSPEKKPKMTSPMKLNRVAVSPTKPATRAASISQSPTKQPLDTIIATPRTPVKKNVEELPLPARTSPRFSNPPPDETPAKAALARMNRLTLTERKVSTSPKKVASKVASPQKSPSKMSTPKKVAIAGPSTPSPTKRRATKPRSTSLESEDEKEAPRVVSSRHRRPPFLDRQFYTYRDPRVKTESDLCVTHFEELVRKFGFPDLRSR